MVKNRYKPILIRFDHTKDTDTAVDFTVFYAFEQYAENANERKLVFAPEILNDAVDPADYQWDKVDVYALGRTILKVLSGRYDTPPTDCEGLDEIQALTLETMLDADPAQRPDVKEIAEIF